MISKELDDFILDKDEPYWIVELNNGDKIYQDDNRPGFSLSAWDRLYDYCKNNNLYIKNIWIKFRSNIVSMPSDKDGYWFKKGLLAGFRKDNGRRFKDVNFFIFGYIENNIMKVIKWRIPELIDWEYEDREIPRSGVIWNNVKRTK